MVKSFSIILNNCLRVFTDTVNTSQVFSLEIFHLFSLKISQLFSLKISQLLSRNHSNHSKISEEITLHFCNIFGATFSKFMEKSRIILFLYFWNSHEHYFKLSLNTSNTSSQFSQIFSVSVLIFQKFLNMTPKIFNNFGFIKITSHFL